MGVNLYIAFDRKKTALEANGSDRVLLAKLREPLSALSQRLANSRLDSFLSYDPEILRGLIDDNAMLEEAMAKMGPAKYFDPAEILPALNAVKEHLSTHAEAFTTVKKADRQIDVVEELDECEKTLIAAGKAKLKFRFYISD
jgi:hypothetical protein